MDELTRRQIRYICFRLQTEDAGGAKAKIEKEGVMKYVGEVRKHMEGQSEFDSWANFAKTWDVGDKSPLVVVVRKESIDTEWNKVLVEEAKELPIESKKKIKK